MKAGTFVTGLMGVLFALSLMANFMALTSLREVNAKLEKLESPSKKRRPVSASRVSVPGEDPRVDQILEELAALRLEVAGDTGGSGSRSSIYAPVPEARVAPEPIRIDPEVETVLAAQSQFRRFWNDLDDVFDAKDKLDPQKYTQTVLDATVRYLGIEEPTKTTFIRETELAVSDLAAARQEYSDARDQLPSKGQVEKAVYDAQKRAIYDRYKERRRGAVARVNRMLDSASPRHEEFTRRTEKWLREMTP